MTEETKKELARYKRYSAALEKEVKSLREALSEIKKTVEYAQDPVYPFCVTLDSKDGLYILEIVEKALKDK